MQQLDPYAIWQSSLRGDPAFLGEYMSAASERQRDEKPVSTSSGSGISYQAVATWALTAVIALVCWVFLSTTSDIKTPIEKQGEDIKTLRKEAAENHLELVKRADAIDKDVAPANAHLIAMADKLGMIQAQIPPQPTPQQQK